MLKEKKRESVHKIALKYSDDPATSVRCLEKIHPTASSEVAYQESAAKFRIRALKGRCTNPAVVPMPIGGRGSGGNDDTGKASEGAASPAGGVCARPGVEDARRGDGDGRR